MEYHLAQINIAKLLTPVDSPEMADFVAYLDVINALAEESDGFVWRLQDVYNNAMSIKVFDDDFIIVNMSAWTTAETLHHFTYHTAHVEVFKQRRKWFDKLSDMHMALWYVPAGHIPTPAEGVARLHHLRNLGPTPYAFTFKDRFTVQELVEYERNGALKTGT